MKAKVLYGLFLAGFMSQLAFGGDSGPALITEMIVSSTAVVIVRAGPIVGSPSCNTGQRWAISLAEPAGIAMHAQLLAAQRDGKLVAIHGYPVSDNCSLGYNAERVLWIDVTY